jgi:methylenetetrahydrofolate--tRNA-(uracil-5-)-methyltransferase
MPKARVTIVGAGLAGCEAAWQLVKRGIPVTLLDMKPHQKSPAHTSPDFAELVCSNSLRGDRLENAPGLLKQELRSLGSLILDAADQTRVPAGGALAVDRKGFSAHITKVLKNHPLVHYESQLVEDFPEEPCIIATGPLTEGALFNKIQAAAGSLHFFDAAAPIVAADSINRDIVFRASRYGRGDDYLNCPFTQEEYHAFIDALITAQCADIREFEEEKLFEGCMPIESIAKRGGMAAAFGPMKPVGLVDPRTGKEPFAVVQLRQDDGAGSLYNLVGFQTRLKFPEQKRVFGMIPGLEEAVFMRYGVMHRNTFINSPGFLDRQFSMLEHPLRFFAGQLSGVEGYVESTSSGLLAGLTMAARLQGMPDPEFSPETAIGALGQYVSTPNKHFQPMNINFGLLPPLDKRVRGKQNRYAQLAQRALAHIGQTIQQRTDLFS